MSGGYFDYRQYILNDIDYSIGKLIAKNVYGFSNATLQEFASARRILQMAVVYAERIDYLVSGDDDEETFHERLEADLSKLEYPDANV